MSESDVTKPLNTWDQDSFLPEDYVKSKGERRANMLSLTLFGVMMLAVVAAFFATNRRWMSVRNEQRSINAMYVREAEKIEELKELEKQRAEMVDKASLTTALIVRVPRSILLAEFINRMPEETTLLEFTLESKRVKVAAAPVKATGKKPKSLTRSPSAEEAKAAAEAAKASGGAGRARASRAWAVGSAWIQPPPASPRVPVTRSRSPGRAPRRVQG